MDEIDNEENRGGTHKLMKTKKKSKKDKKT